LNNPKIPIFLYADANIHFFCKKNELFPIFDALELLCPPASLMMQEDGDHQREGQPWTGSEGSVGHDGQEGYFESAGNFGSVGSLGKEA
jgi:hypothetical protein